MRVSILLLKKCFSKKHFYPQINFQGYHQSHTKRDLLKPQPFYMHVALNSYITFRSKFCVPCELYFKQTQLKKGCSKNFFKTLVNSERTHFYAIYLFIFRYFCYFCVFVCLHVCLIWYFYFVFFIKKHTSYLIKAICNKVCSSMTHTSSRFYFFSS